VTPPKAHKKGKQRVFHKLIYFRKNTLMRLLDAKGNLLFHRAITVIVNAHPDIDAADPLSDFQIDDIKPLHALALLSLASEWGVSVSQAVEKMIDERVLMERGKAEAELESNVGKWTERLNDFYRSPPPQ
jgi:hypothetical protein